LKEFGIIFRFRILNSGAIRDNEAKLKCSKQSLKEFASNCLVSVLRGKRETNAPIDENGEKEETNKEPQHENRKKKVDDPDRAVQNSETKIGESGHAKLGIITKEDDVQELHDEGFDLLLQGAGSRQSFF